METTLSYKEFIDKYGDELYVEYIETSDYYENLTMETYCKAMYDMYIEGVNNESSRNNIL